MTIRIFVLFIFMFCSKNVFGKAKFFDLEGTIRHSQLIAVVLIDSTVHHPLSLAEIKQESEAHPSQPTYEGKFGKRSRFTVLDTIYMSDSAGISLDQSRIVLHNSTFTCAKPAIFDEGQKYLVFLRYHNGYWIVSNYHMGASQIDPEGQIKDFFSQTESFPSVITLPAATALIMKNVDNIVATRRSKSICNGAFQSKIGDFSKIAYPNCPKGMYKEISTSNGITSTVCRMRCDTFSIILNGWREEKNKKGERKRLEQYLEGNLEGVHEVVYGDGGRRQYFYKNGKPRQDAIMKNGEIDGPVRTWDEFGNLIE